MSRNAGAHDSAGESFAGVLEHLTRHPRPEAPAARSLLPATERKPGRDAADADGVPLSYEQALRLHARRKAPPSADLDLPPVATAKSAQPQRETPPAAKAADAPRSSPPTRSAGGRAGHATLKPAAQSPVPTGTQAKKSPARRRASVESRDAASVPSASGPAAKPQAKAPTSQRKPKPSAGAKSASGANPASGDKRARTRRNARQAAFKAAIQTAVQGAPVDARPETARPPVAAPQTAFQAIAPRPNPGRSLATVGRGGEVQVERQVQLDILRQRRTIVSVRLTDAELDRLKDRALESGISVSAYMRSCILDADQLRAQVKQTLAEIRAFGLRPEPSLPAGLSLPEKRQAGGPWLQGVQLLLRSATFLMGSWFRFGRSA